MNINSTLNTFYNVIEDLLTQLEETPLNNNLYISFEKKLELFYKIENDFFYKKYGEQFITLIDADENQHIICNKLIELYRNEKLIDEKRVIILMIKKLVETHLAKLKISIAKLSENYFTPIELRKMSLKLEQWIKENLTH